MRPSFVSLVLNPNHESEAKYLSNILNFRTRDFSSLFFVTVTQNLERLTPHANDLYRS